MKSKEGKLSLDFMGGLTKFLTPNQQIRKFQVKTFGNGNDGEIDGITRAFAKWASAGNIPELANFAEKVPSAQVPWKITIPMGDFGIYLDMDFGHNLYTDEPGMQMKVKLVELAISVKNGDRDIIMSGITITPKRQESVDFSYPYFAAHQLILTQRDLKVSRLSELKGKNIAVCANSAGDIVSSKAFGKSSPNIKRFDNTPLALEELNAGGVDAAVGDVGVFAYYAQQNPDKKFNMTRDPEFEDQYFGIAVRKGNKKVLRDVNEGLRKVIKSGAYAKVYAKWFGANTPVPKLPVP